MKRLVIKHGEQILRYELKDTPVVVGREVGCDLTFDDPSLSRRHGSFEASPTGVRFVDLGSRNGSWVNFKKTKEAELKPGDTVRIGALLITYQYEEPAPPPPPPPQEEDPGDDTATVIASTKAQEPAVKPGPKTPPLPPPVAPSEPPPVRPAPSAPSAPPPPAPAPAAPAVQEKTVLLDRKTASPPEAAGTRILRREDHVAQKPAPSKGGTSLIDTARLPQEAASPRALSPPPHPAAPTAPPGALPAAPAVEAEEAPTAPGWSWTAKQAAILLSATFTVYVVLALPLVRTLGNALREESLRRGRVLLDLLAATNATAMAEGRSRDLDVDPVTREERVQEALLLSLDGKLLAPSSRVGETLSRIEGIEPDVAAIRTFYLGRRGDGDYVMVEPVLDRGLRVGLAVVVYEVATTSGSWAVAVLFLGFLVLLLAVVAALLLAKRFTLAPLQALQDDVEAVVKGDAARLPLAQGFAELSEIARSVNRLIERSTPAPVAASLPRVVTGLPPVDRPPRVEPAPAPGPPARPTPPVTATPLPPAAASPPPPSASRAEAGEGARFWADANFIVARAEDEAARLMGASPDTLEGRHVIEAIKDQKLLGVVLDALNALEGGSPSAPTVAELPDGSLSVSAHREGEWVVVSLVRLKRTQ